MFCDHGEPVARGAGIAANRHHLRRRFRDADRFRGADLHLVAGQLNQLNYNAGCGCRSGRKHNLFGNRHGCKWLHWRSHGGRDRKPASGHQHCSSSSFSVLWGKHHAHCKRGSYVYLEPVLFAELFQWCYGGCFTFCHHHLLGNGNRNNGLSEPGRDHSEGAPCSTLRSGHTLGQRYDLRILNSNLQYRRCKLC